MRRLLIVLAVLFLITPESFSQKMVQGSGTASLYLSHSVKAKEGLYSIGRLYSISPKDIAAYNNMDVNQGLNIGQVIKIPLNTTNFSQERNASSQPGAMPVYYTVKEKEGMYRVSVNHNKVPYEHIKLWNGLSSDALNVGQPLIIGYVMATGETAAAETPAPAQPEPTTPVKETPKETPPPVAQKQETPPPPVKEAPKPVAKETKEPVYLPKGNSYFQRAFEDEIKGGRTVKTTTLSGAIFKSTSGWQDGKFYILMNNVPPGTLVKLKNLGTNKTIFAKVLGEVPDLRQNSGLSFRLSNSAAAELGVKTETERFNLEITL